MKGLIAFLACIVAGIGIGWYWGHSRAVSEYQRDALQRLPALESQLTDLNRERAEESKAAKPYEASGASIALASLKSLDANDVAGAKSRLAATVAIYYRSHLSDGDTDLLKSIESFAASDSVLSNSIYSK